MDFALRQPWADAQGYNLSPLRGWLSSAAMSTFTRYANTRRVTKNSQPVSSPIRFQHVNYFVYRLI